MRLQFGIFSHVVLYVNMVLYAKNTVDLGDRVSLFHRLVNYIHLPLNLYEYYFYIFHFILTSRNALFFFLSVFYMFSLCVRVFVNSVTHRNQTCHRYYLRKLFSQGEICWKFSCPWLCSVASMQLVVPTHLAFFFNMVYIYDSLIFTFQSIFSWPGHWLLPGWSLSETKVDKSCTVLHLNFSSCCKVKAS